MVDFNQIQFQINPENTAYIMLLLVPVVATIVGIARHIIGVKSLGIYAPIVLTFAFYALGLNGTYGNYSDVLTGIRYGLISMTAVISASYLSSIITKRGRMHYFPKIAISLSISSALLFIIVWIADELGREGFTATNALAFILIVSVAEQFSSTMAKKNITSAIMLSIETVAISIFSYILIAWPSFQRLILDYPYLVLITLVINYWVGRYQGLRLREYYRFRQILNSPNQED